MILKPHPKDNEPRTFGVRPGWLEQVAEHIRTHGIKRDELLFSTQVGTPISGNTFRSRVWLPAVAASGIDFRVRIHDPSFVHLQLVGLLMKDNLIADTMAIMASLDPIMGGVDK